MTNRDLSQPKEKFLFTNYVCAVYIYYVYTHMHVYIL